MDLRKLPELTPAKQAIIDGFQPYGMNNLVYRLPIEEKSAQGVALPRSSYNRNRNCLLIRKGSGIVADNRQFIAATEAPEGSEVSILQLEDHVSKMLDPSIRGYYVQSGKVIEGVVVNEPWKIPFNELPQRLQDLYQQGGYRY